ncbi:hypothetical protein PRO82_000721 [Candidatus Protochlamydia amoebophila]|nr:hypothetical protein [Candidatus Protochlamydia amoebophila]
MIKLAIEYNGQKILPILTVKSARQIGKMLINLLLQENKQIGF